jgi:cyclophilin family peptidyl-prolyl cis-trans isomerase
LAAALIVLLLSAPASPELPVKAGAPIRLDGLVEEAEWADAWSAGRDRPGGGKIHLRIKRTGPWLAIGIDADKAYAGEVLRIFTTDATAAWTTNVNLGLGQPALPTAAWRRGSPELFDRSGLGSSPRACLVRLDVGGSERWSGEALVRLGSLGIGRGDLRDLRGLFMIVAYDPSPRPALVVPDEAADPRMPATYARLVSADRWGAAETWPAITSEESQELDDADLLHRLCVEHAEVQRKETPEELVIATAIRPRSMSRVDTLRRQLEAGRARNPTLPAWTYFLGRLVHGANLYDEAAQIIESIPQPLRRMDTFATLIAEHDIDTERFDLAEEICKACTYLPTRETLLSLAVEGKAAQEKERAAVAKDEAKEEKNPRARFVTSKGEFVVELFEDDAPGMVRNFVDLVLKRRYYDGLHFHDVRGARFAVVGDPRTRLGTTETRPGPGFRLRADGSERGLLSGYLVAQPLADNTFHGSQFFLTLAPMVGEKERTCSFGRVVEGMDVLLRLEQDDMLERVEIISRRNHAYDPSSARMDR